MIDDSCSILAFRITCLFGKLRWNMNHRSYQPSNLILNGCINTLGQKQKVKHAIGPLKRPDGSITTTKFNEECAEALACFFKSVFIHEDLQDLPDFPGRVNDAIPNLVITEELVYQKLMQPKL